MQPTKNKRKIRGFFSIPWEVHQILSKDAKNKMMTFPEYIRILLTKQAADLKNSK